MQPIDLGAVLSLSGAAVLTTYTAGSTVYGGRPDKFRFTATCVSVAGTAPTSFELKCSASEDGVNFYDVESEEDADEIADAPAIEHSFTIAAPGTLRASLTVDGKYKHLRVSGKFTGSAGEAGESLTVSAVAT